VLAAGVALASGGAPGGGRWSGSALRGQVGEQTGAAPADAVGGTAPGRATAAG
jgi:hypothetical protein